MSVQDLLARSSAYTGALSDVLAARPLDVEARLRLQASVASFLACVADDLASAQGPVDLQRRLIDALSGFVSNVASDVGVDTSTVGTPLHELAVLW